jgi:hypothetical protein
VGAAAAVPAAGRGHGREAGAAGAAVRRVHQRVPVVVAAGGCGGVQRVAAGEARAPSTILAYQQALRLFCDFAADPRYGWAAECEQRFGSYPVQCVSTLPMCRWAGSARAGGRGRWRRSAAPLAACTSCGLDAPVALPGETPLCLRCASGATRPCAGCRAPTISRAAGGSPAARAVTPGPGGPAGGAGGCASSSGWQQRGTRNCAGAAGPAR